MSIASLHDAEMALHFTSHHVTRRFRRTSLTVIPAKAGIQFLFARQEWIPAFAGMTVAFFGGGSAALHSHGKLRRRPQFAPHDVANRLERHPLAAQHFAQDAIDFGLVTAALSPARWRKPAIISLSSHNVMRVLPGGGGSTAPRLPFEKS